MERKKRSALFSLICLSAAVFFFISNSAFSQEAQSAEKLGVLKEIIVLDSPDFLDVKLIIDSYSYHKVFELVQPERIVIDLFNIEDIQAEPVTDVNLFRVIRIRQGMFQRGVARVVFDVEEDFPFYGIERTPEGLKITFSSKQDPSQRAVETEETVEIETPKKPEGKTEEKIEKQAEAKKTEEVKEEPVGTIEEQLAETKKTLDDTISILNQLNEERLRQKQKFIRVLVTGNYFSPREGNLKTVYEKGMMFGAEINVGVTDFVEIWLAENYFSKTVTNADMDSDSNSDSNYRVNLIPLELGLKVRLNKGIINPYFGIGGGYFQYREETPDGEIREQNIGFIGQSGLFLKISGFFVVDINAQFKYCPIETAVEKFDVGGFHFGVGLGFEF